MTYFELFEIPVKLKVDGTTLKKKFFELSRKYHPDHFAGAAEKEQSESLEKSAQLNKALKTLQNPGETIKYVLQLKGLQEEEEKYQLPPDFLMEMMEINEQLADAKMEDDQATIGDLQLAIEDVQSRIYEPVKEIVEGYEEGITTEEELLKVKEYYYKKKYLKRIKHQLNGKT